MQTRSKEGRKEGGAKEVMAVTRRTNVQRSDNISRSDV